MSGRYLTLDRYNGSLSGEQEMPGAPNSIHTPGGFATIQHHWTEGLGGVGDRTPDVFAGTGDRYAAGVYGHLYHPNSHGSAHDYYHGPQSAQTQETTLDGQPYHWQSKKSSTTEGFANVNANFDLIENDADPVSAPVSAPPTTLLKNFETDVSTKASEPPPAAPTKTSAYLLLMVFLLAFITFDFWAESVHYFIRQRLHGGKDITWQRYVLYSIGATFVLLGFMYVIGIPLQDIESSSLIPPF